MRIPGFTAGASLYKVDHSYNRADTAWGEVKPDSSSGTVELAFLIGRKDFCTACEDAGGVCIRTPHGNFCA